MKKAKIKSLIDKNNLEGINYSSTIFFYVLYTKKEKLYPDYVLKYYSKPEKQVVCFDHSKYEKMVL